MHRDILGKANCCSSILKSKRACALGRGQQLKMFLACVEGVGKRQSRRYGAVKSETVLKTWLLNSAVPSENSLWDNFCARGGTFVQEGEEE